MAANRIKGITIEIGGDTSKLDKALEKTNATIKQSQSQLKDLDRLLKLDPGNTELLQQKFRTLGTDIEATKDKLSTLKTASEQADKALASGNMSQSQYDALQREIVETEQKLKSLTREYENFGSVSAQQIAVAGQKMQQAGDKISSAGKAILPVSLAVAGVGAKSVEMAASFEYAMDKVGALSGATAEELDKLKESARGMAKETKYTADETASAMQYMALAGWDAQEMMSGLPGILHLAGASGEDLAMVSDVVTDGLTAFGLSAQDCDQFVNTLAVTMAKSNTNVEMLGEAFKYVGPVAGQMGYSVNDVAVALGLMANSGIKASNAGTSLRSVMTRMAKPTKESQIAMDALNISLDDGNGNMKSFATIMQELRKGFSGLKMPINDFNSELSALDEQLEAGEMSEKDYNNALEELMTRAYGAEGALKAQYAAMLAGKTGMAGLMTIVGASDEEFAELTRQINGSSEGMGAANEMYSQMTDNLQGRLDILKSAISDLAIQLGNSLMPMIEKVVAKIQQFADWLDSLSDSQKQTVVNILLLVAALGPFLIILGKVVGSIGTMMTWAPQIVGFLTALPGKFTPIIAALGGISAPILLIIGVVVALGAAFKHLWDTNEEFRNSMIAIWEDLKSAFEEFGQGITERINALGFDFENIVEVIKALWDGFCNYLAPVFEYAWNLIATVIKTALDIILGLWDFWVAVFEGDFSGAWDAIKGILSSAWEGIKNIVLSFLNTIDKLTGGKLSDLASKFTDKFEGIKNTVKNALDWIKEKFDNLKLKLPDIKLPHFNIEGNLSINPPSVPSISIDWYKKAMDGGMILNSPTIFGAMGGKLLGAGEAGSETVVGTGSLMGMIQNAVGSTGINTMVELMSEYLPYLAEGTEIRLDSGALVGATALQMNSALGKISAREGRR